MIIQLGLHFEVFFLVSFLNRFSLYDHPLFHIYVSNILLSTMEVNAEKGVAKYSKLLEDKVKKNNDISLFLAQEIQVRFYSFLIILLYFKWCWTSDGASNS